MNEWTFTLQLTRNQVLALRDLLNLIPFDDNSLALYQCLPQKVRALFENKLFPEEE